MFKRLMIGLIALSLAVIWVSEAAATYWVGRRSAVVTVTYESAVDQTGSVTVPFTTGIFGLPPDADGNCGEVRGELYCAQNDSTAAIAACEAATGDSSALVAVLDPDALPNSWPQEYYNFDYKEFGQRLELARFLELGPSMYPNTVKTIKLPAGTKKAVGWHFIKDVTMWQNGDSLTVSEALKRYTGNRWDSTLGKYIPEDNFGVNGEDYLMNIPLEFYYGADLSKLEGKTVLAAWRHDQVKWQGDSLKGNYYGLAAFKVLSYIETSNEVEVEVMSVREVNGRILYNNPLSGTTASGSDEFPCLESEAVVFAPYPYNSTVFVDAFYANTATAEVTCTGDVTSGYACQGSVEVVLNRDTGQELCEAKNPDVDGVYFVDLIPINRSPDKNAFMGTIESIPGNPDLLELKCKEGSVDGGSSNVKFSRYDCMPLISDEEIPDCAGFAQKPWAVNEIVEECPAR